jgi:hypothetical protein
MSRFRTFIQTAAFGLMLLSGFSMAAPASPEVRKQTMQVFQRIFCGDKGQGIAFLHAQGRAYGHIEGIRDEKLFDVDVYAVQQCGPLPNTVKDVGFRLTSKEILFYRDPVTGEVLKTWKNPYTGQTVEVNHAANDPVNGNYTSAVFFDGILPNSVQQTKDLYTLSYEANQFYENPLGGDYQKYVGGMYRATEMINWMVSTADLERLPADAFLPTHFSWARISQWLPWMEMGGRQGYFYVHTVGQKFMRYEDLPQAVRTEVETNYRDFLTPPPLDDTRPNDTSWKFFKRAIDARGKK